MAGLNNIENRGDPKCSMATEECRVAKLGDLAQAPGECAACSK
ncbi:MAG TPA: hypothetical protein VKU01_23235 [Bryobacteraceae bacterium]|nr:hypothetical protein [Bryobacteraceae bacterium]